MYSSTEYKYYLCMKYHAVSSQIIYGTLTVIEKKVLCFKCVPFYINILKWPFASVLRFISLGKGRHLNPLLWPCGQADEGITMVTRK